MDIDTPAAPTADPGSFALGFPLPFRILSLISLGILAWATNLHGVTAIGVDAAHVLDVRIDDYDPSAPPVPTTGSPCVLPRVNNPSPIMTTRRGFQSVNASLYGPVYKLGSVMCLWTCLGWILFRYYTSADPVLVRQFSAIPFIWLLSSILFLTSPQHHFFRRERWMVLQCLKRTAVGGWTDPVAFSDVLFADIMTSFAKVFGDLWVSTCLLISAEHGLASQLNRVGCHKDFMVPLLTSLPYVFRLRQCLAEYFGNHTATPRRSLLNALKYATAFPVIILSAVQSVYGDPYDESLPNNQTKHVQVEVDVDSDFGRYALFQIWIVAVLVNSLYSFWWDVTNDWGLSLLSVNGNTVKSGAGSIRLPPNSGPPSRSVSRSRSEQQQHHQQKWSRGQSASWFTSPETRHQQHRSRGHSVQLQLPDTPEMTSEPFVFPPRPPSPAKTKTSSHVKKKSLFNLPFPADPPFLRSSLLLPDPLMYYLLIAIDLILRFTWSLKLSSHLHSVHELESGVYSMEALELIRRWMWAFVRIEWEAVRKGGAIMAELSPDSDEQSVIYEQSGLGGSAYLRVDDVVALKSISGKTRVKECDYESDSSLVIISRDGETM